ncbi:MAG TPA: glycosyltransferase, partial [Acidimicrobiia bacterium]|nr:glycosyltransferase [Acidimicrobiia bacterium]
GGGAGPLVVCLLLARNAARLLPDALESIGRFADAIVALDDGSDDATGVILQRHPQVQVGLTNRVHEGAAGQDGASWNRLLAAAAELRPQWIMSVGADERLDESDAEAVRHFVAHEALAGCAYGFRRYQMAADERFDPRFEWAYRLFRFRPGQRFAHEATDVVPIPVEIPTHLWVPTTLRIKHYHDGEVPGPPPAGGQRWEARAPGAPVLPRPTDLDVPPRPVPARFGRGKVVCLLPAHNAAAYLEGWFESVASFADAVVALDDGSTDGTGDLLEANPLVELVLRNPPRAGYQGWHDSTNRNRLLQAAASLDPDWIIFIDADEVVPRDEGDALRRFIDEDAVPGIAYAFPVYRMIDDLEHYDQVDNRAALRLFAYRPGQVIPDGAHHVPPAPASIPLGRRLVTNLRIQHLNGLTAQRRRARRRKYVEADPARVWEPDFSYTDAPPGEVKPWLPRREGTPVILRPIWDEWGAVADEDELDPDWPVLSVVAIVDEGAVDEMADLLDEVGRQELHHPLEVIVLALGADVADDVARLRPGATVVQIPPRSTPGSSRNVGLQIARGDYIVFFDAPAELAPGALAALVEEHDGGSGVITGGATNRVPSAVGWASYFDDPGRSSFARVPLLRAGGFADELTEGVEAVARDRLLQGGQRAGHTSLIAFGHTTELANRHDYLRQRFARGRAAGRRGRGQLSAIVRGDLRRLSASWRAPPAGTAEPFERVRALVVGGTLASWAGVLYEQLAPLLRRRERSSAGGDPRPSG